MRPSAPPEPPSSEPRAPPKSLPCAYVRPTPPKLPPRGDHATAVPFVTLARPRASSRSDVSPLYSRSASGATARRRRRPGSRTNRVWNSFRPGRRRRRRAPRPRGEDRTRRGRRAPARRRGRRARPPPPNGRERRLAPEGRAVRGREDRPVREEVAPPRDDGGPRPRERAGRGEVRARALGLEPLARRLEGRHGRVVRRREGVVGRRRRRRLVVDVPVEGAARRALP